MSDGYHTVRSGPPRVSRSGLTGTWYVVNAPYKERDDDPRYVIASHKREIHQADAEALEDLYDRATWLEGPDAEKRVIAALEAVDRRIQAAVGSDVLFSEEDDRDRGDYAREILKELTKEEVT